MAKAKYTYNAERKEWYTLVYDGTYTPAGKKRRRRISSKKSSADLEKKVIAYKQELEQRSVAFCRYTFGEYAQIWFNTAKATKEMNTQRMYASVLHSSFNSINHIPLVQINHSHFQMCINEKMEHPRTCQNIALTFKQIIKSAVKDRYLPKSALDDILEGVSLPKYQKPVKRPLTAVEKEALEMADLDAKKRAFVSVLYYTGLRRGEALALTPSDFDWDAKTLSVSKAWIATNNAPSIKPYPKSANGVRIVPLPEKSIQYIKPFVEACDSEFLFHSEGQRLMTEAGYFRMWNSIITSMNVALGYNPYQKVNKPEPPIQDLTAHIFRHNYCTELCYQVPTISTKMIARLMGDTERMVLEVYSHINELNENVTGAINNIF